MYTPDPDLPAKPHHFMSKRLGISISLVLFVLVLLLSYALCSLQVDRSTQAILADKNRFLLSKIDTMQIRLQDWRRTMLEQTNTLALSESVRLFAAEEIPTLGDLDQPFGMGERRWRDVLARFHEDHDEILVDADARSTAYFVVDEVREVTDHVWHVTQIFHDADGDNDFRIEADVDLDATQDEGEAVFKTYRAGSVEDLAQ